MGSNSRKIVGEKKPINYYIDVSPDKKAEYAYRTSAGNNNLWLHHLSK